ncbi:MAG: hypothetical protein IPM59_05875 [Chloracidobacterium sp.]|nr:hypothetical protein [Chloracidobacterium sp.]
MNDMKNALLAWLSSTPSLVAAADPITIISAIIVPVVLFTLGKTVDVLIQLYVTKRRRRD